MNIINDVKVSLVINTLNEEANIEDCINSAEGLFDELIVCDMESTDRTREIAESLGAKVVLFPRGKFVEEARKFAVQQAKYEWIFVLDADERLNPEVINELKYIIRTKDVDVVRLKWRVLFMGKFLYYGTWGWGGGGTGLPRFFKKSVYLKEIDKYKVKIHSNFPMFPNSYPRQAFAKERFDHLSYPTLDIFTYKTLHKYSKLDAECRYKENKRVRFWHFITKPLYQFVASYIRNLGFLDSIEGFINAVGFAIYEFLIIAHLYEMQRNKS